MKKNEQGFVLMETLIVSTFIIGTLVYLFVQFSNIQKNYDISFHSNTIPGLYGAHQITDYLSKIDQSTILNTLTENGYVELQDCNLVTSHRTYCETLMQMLDAKTVLLVPDDIDEFKKSIQKQNPFSEDLYQYINRLKTSNTTNKRVIIEYNDRTIASILLLSGGVS